MSRITWKKHCLLTLFAEGSVKTSRDARSLLAFHANIIYKLSRKTWKNTVFSHSMQNAMQKAVKTLFSCVLCEIITSATKNVRKYCFLKLFAERLAKRSENAVFFHNIGALYKKSRKTWKTLFFHTFSWKVGQKAKRTKFSCILCELCTVCHKNRKKHCLLTVFRNVVQKVKKKYFLAFMELITNCHTKPEKHCFLSVFPEGHAMSWMNVVFLHFMLTHYKVSRETWKNTVFLTLIAEHRTKSSKNAVFLDFFRT